METEKDKAQREYELQKEKLARDKEDRALDKKMKMAQLEGFAADRDLRKSKHLESRAQQFAGGLQKIESDFENGTKGLKASLDAFKADPNALNTNQLVTTVVRLYQGGVLTDRDLDRMALPSLPRSFNEWQNWSTGSTSPNFTPELRQSLVKAAEVGYGAAVSNAQNKAKAYIENNAKTQRDVLGSEYADAVLTPAQRYGLDVKMKDKSVEVAPKEQQAAQKRMPTREEALAELQKRKASQGAR
jgi:hypothetical protein